jgi:hypothetical protein
MGKNLEKPRVFIGFHWDLWHFMGFTGSLWEETTM